MKLVLLFAFTLLISWSHLLAATCVAGDAGKQRYTSGIMEFCDGANWYAMGRASLGACGVGEAGKTKYAAGAYQYCNGSDWLTMKGDVGAACTAGIAGKQRYNSGNMEFCDGTNWYNMKSCNATLSNYTWTGLGGNTNWNTAANWYNNLVPGSGNVAKFNCIAGSNDTVLMNAAVSVAGINIASNFTGTITQGAGFTLTIGSSGWVQAGATFVGGNANTTFAANAPFTLTNGNYTATSATTSFTGNATLTYAAGTFNHNSGTWKYDNAQAGFAANKTYTISMTPASIAFHHLISGGTSNYENAFFNLSVASGKSVIVEGDFTLGGVTYTLGNSCLVGGGQIDLRGNLKTGSLLCAGGLANLNGSILFSGTANQTYQFPAGISCYGTGGYQECTYPTFVINKTAGTVSAAAGTTSLGVVSLYLQNGTFNAPTGTMDVRSTFSQTGGTWNHNNGTFAWDAVQLGTGFSYEFGFAASDPSVTFKNVIITGSSNYLAGTYTLTIPAGKTIVATGNFQMAKGPHTYGDVKSTGGTIEVQGNWTIGAGATGGTTAIKLSGTAAQTYTNSGGTNLSGLVTIDKASGTLTLNSNLSLNTAGQSLMITSGEINLNARNLVVNNLITLQPAGTFTVNTGTYSPLYGSANFIDNGGTFVP